MSDDIEKAVKETQRHEVELIISDFLNELDEAINLTGLRRIMLRHLIEKQLFED